MEVVNNKTDNPLRYYRSKAKELDPYELSRKSGISFNGNLFFLTIMGRPVSLEWPELVCRYEDDGEETSNSFVFLFSRLVMFGSLSSGSGKMLAYNETPWGSHYYMAFKARCLNRLAGTYGHCAKKLAEDGKKIGATEVPGGDCSIEFEYVPGLTVRATVWEGDDEFPANAQILFSDSFLLAFSAEDMAAVGDTFMNALKGRW